MVHYESLSEEELCDLIKKRDQKAFEYVHSLYNDKVRNFIASKCSDYLLAEEITQIAWVKVWNKIDGFQNKSKLFTWICRIAFNAFYDYKRKHKREVFFEDITEDDQDEERMLAKFSVEVRTPSKNLEEKDEFSYKSKKFNKILDGLSEEKKEMADLVLLQGMSYEQASKKANVPIGTVMSRVYYLRKELQRNWDV